MTEREIFRQQFLDEIGWGNATQTALAQDASFRRYFRLNTERASAMLMDAPPERETVFPFIQMANHLENLGIRAPIILHSEVNMGFVLLEDLGDDTFTRLLSQGESDDLLYEQAVDTLIQLHRIPESTKIKINHYDFEHIQQEISLFTHWYLTAKNGKPLSKSVELEFIEIWKEIFESLPDIGQALVLRDYHVDNLMIVKDQCAVLDFQDALIGSPAYDLVSLLEDARRDISPAVIDQCYNKYIDSFPELRPEEFTAHYAVWGMQRHCKVAGIFTRLWLRDDKPKYLDHLPRVLKMITYHLQHPLFTKLNDWFNSQKIDINHAPFKTNKSELKKKLNINH